MVCVGTEMTGVSAEIDLQTASMTKNLTEMKSVRQAMSCVSKEIGFVGM